MATDLRDSPGEAPGSDVIAGPPRRRRRRLVAIVGVIGLPTTVLVDGSGRIVARRLGKVAEAELVSLIERAFGAVDTGGPK